MKYVSSGNGAGDITSPAENERPDSLSVNTMLLSPAAVSRLKEAGATASVEGLKTGTITRVDDVIGYGDAGGSRYMSTNEDGVHGLFSCKRGKTTWH